MSTVTTLTAAGAKATTSVKLDKDIFGCEVKNHELLKSAYLAYQSNQRSNLAVTKKRGEVRGGGKKPWRQKGTGRARVGSSRNPVWRGGGIAFGPTGNENYSQKLNVKAKRTAIRQALSLAAVAGKVSVIEAFEFKDGKAAQASKLFDKIGAHGQVLIVVSVKDDLVKRATNNLPNIYSIHALSLNVYDVLNADTILISKKSLDLISGWLGSDTKKTEKQTPTAQTAKNVTSVSTKATEGKK